MSDTIKYNIAEMEDLKNQLEAMTKRLSNQYDKFSKSCSRLSASWRGDAKASVDNALKDMMYMLICQISELNQIQDYIKTATTNAVSADVSSKTLIQDIQK